MADIGPEVRQCCNCGIKEIRDGVEFIIEAEAPVQ